MINHGFDYRRDTTVSVFVSLAAAGIVGVSWLIPMGAILIKFGQF